MPLSWRHYVYGMRHLTRAAARETLRTHHAVAAAQFKASDRDKFIREQREIADV